MSQILEILKNHGLYIYISIFVILIAIALTIAVNVIAKKLKFLKYLPGLILILIGFFSIFTVINNLFDSNHLNNLIVFVITTSAGIIALLFALIIGIIEK